MTIAIHNTFFFVAGLPVSDDSKTDCPQALNILTLNTAFSSVKTPVIIHDVVFSGEISSTILSEYFPAYIDNPNVAPYFAESYVAPKMPSLALFANNVNLKINNTVVLNILHSSGCVTVRTINNHKNFVKISMISLSLGFYHPFVLQFI